MHWWRNVSATELPHGRCSKLFGVQRPGGEAVPLQLPVHTIQNRLSWTWNAQPPLPMPSPYTSHFLPCQNDKKQCKTKKIIKICAIQDALAAASQCSVVAFLVLLLSLIHCQCKDGKAQYSQPLWLQISPEIWVLYFKFPPLTASFFLFGLPLNLGFAEQNIQFRKYTYTSGFCLNDHI